jgi:hypothetical protein
MARRSLLTPALEDRAPAPEAPAVSTERQAPPIRPTKPSRHAKLHIGGYYDPNDGTIIAFQKLGIDLRRPQQDMLLEAISDFVAKHQAERAFR